ncbi:MAG TPA: nucleoside-diphosphate sugar epimerase/dehydratase [Burkholderiales bacterium]|nr:nucleoside-diphosphate sugar epimerase/dehydratase [Burkholderiales bacterium]
MLLPRFNIRSLLAFAHDVFAAAAAWCIAYWLRFNMDIEEIYLISMLRTLPWVVISQAIIFLWFGLYRGIWRYASLPDLKRILLAVLLAATAVPLAVFMLRINAVVPRSVLVIDPILLFLIMCGSRIAYRLWKEHRMYNLANLQAKPVIVLGAGDAAVGLVKDLARSHEWRIAGFLDDNPKNHGTLLHGVKVLGRVDELPAIAEKMQIQHAIIAMPKATHAARRRAMNVCISAGVKALTVPSFDDLLSGKVTVSQIRHVELDDLLGRDPVVLDSTGLQELLAGKTILVTGAGGSIGSELCRQISRFRPQRIILFDVSEYALYRIEQEFHSDFSDTAIACAIGDIKNRARIDQVLEQYRPSVVFHAAAYKHVPLMEEQNAWEALLNNALGTYVTAQAAVAHRVEKFVLVSTDKAVNPTNVMGASKRLAEMLCQALQQSSDTRFVMVRFGNVLGSTGSVIPKFREQIEKGGPVTVTHPDIMRYFMSIPEAAQLVLQSAVMGKGGEIFVMDMGDPVKIYDLARDLIQLSGFGEEEIKIVYTGLRPGEKLYEELLADEESTLPTPHAKLRIASARPVEMQWLNSVLKWLTQPQALHGDQVKQELSHWVPEYSLGQNRPARQRSLSI